MYRYTISPSSLLFPPLTVDLGRRQDLDHSGVPPPPPRVVVSEQLLSQPCPVCFSHVNYEQVTDQLKSWGQRVV